MAKLELELFEKVLRVVLYFCIYILAPFILDLKRKEGRNERKKERPLRPFTFHT